MKIYFTIENIDKLKQCFINLKMYNIIDINNILNDCGYDYNELNEIRTFIINQKIDKQISNFIKSKNYKNIIYINPYINENNFYIITNNLKSKYNIIKEFVLLDNYNIPKCTNLYSIVDEVVFFPSYKKIKLIECTPFKTN